MSPTRVSSSRRPGAAALVVGRLLVAGWGLTGAGCSTTPERTPADNPIVTVAPSVSTPSASGAAGVAVAAAPEIPLGLDLMLPVPRDNPLRFEKIELGRRLFFDRRLSGDGTVACASCHIPERAFSDGRRVAVGIGGRLGHRNTPSLLNRAYERRFFWDGRVGTLEEQTLLPLEGADEMGSTRKDIVQRLAADPEMRRSFRSAFGSSEVTIERVATAIASFERTLLSGASSFDRFRAGERDALSTSARRGLALFRGKARCALCHDGALFTDERFHNTGAGWGTEPRDLGRYAITGLDRDRGKFETPSLRNVSATAPYMHDGSLENLAQVLEFYDRGGNSNPYLDPLVRPLRLSVAEINDLLEFLRSLTGEISARARLSS